MLERRDERIEQEDLLREEALNIEYDFEGLPLAYNEVNGAEQRKR
jgi:hypothetical protein